MLKMRLDPPAGALLTVMLYGEVQVSGYKDRLICILGAAVFLCGLVPTQHDDTEELLARANLKRGNLQGARAMNAYLPGVNLVGENLYGAELSGARLMKANLSGTLLTGAKLVRAVMKGANLTDAYLSHADLSGANLAAAQLPGAQMYDAKVRDADFSGANLARAALRGADLTHANLTSADLIHADLVRTDLIQANLKSADLQGADLSHADLTGVDLRGANLKGAMLDGALYDKATRWPARFLPEKRGAVLDIPLSKDALRSRFAEKANLNDFVKGLEYVWKRRDWQSLVYAVSRRLSYTTSEDYDDYFDYIGGNRVGFLRRFLTRWEVDRKIGGGFWKELGRWKKESDWRYTVTEQWNPRIVKSLAGEFTGMRYEAALVFVPTKGYPQLMVFLTKEGRYWRVSGFKRNSA
jgi:uncharacterized protein YjbI with pentapeptide repeats